MNIKIGIASDHRGFAAKEKIIEFLDNNDINVVDFGTNSSESVDFPLYAKKLGNAIQNEEVDLGIAICGTGIGMSIVLNKMKLLLLEIKQLSKKTGIDQFFIKLQLTIPVEPTIIINWLIISRFNILPGRQKWTN